MKWDMENNCPIPGTYTSLNLPGSLVIEAKRKCEATGNGLYVPETIASFFENGNLTIDDFFLQHRHKELDDILDMEVLLLLSSYYRREEMKVHIWDVIGGALDFPRWDDEKCDVPCRLYFCESVDPEEEYCCLPLKGLSYEYVSPVMVITLTQNLDKDYESELRDYVEKAKEGGVRLRRRW